MRYTFIKDHEAVHPVRRLCQNDNRHHTVTERFEPVLGHADTPAFEFTGRRRCASVMEWLGMFDLAFGMPELPRMFHT